MIIVKALSLLCLDSRAQTNLVEFEHSFERTFECSLRNSNFAINSMRKCALISKVEKWHPHFKEWLQMLPVQVILVNLCP